MRVFTRRAWGRPRRARRPPASRASRARAGETTIETTPYLRRFQRDSALYTDQRTEFAVLRVAREI